ncbi:MAG: AAA family ATPase [Solitalea-like symbiont of Acarus siro]
MLPISIKIECFYSYQTLQTIDFIALYKNNIFGIFGPVGSGKSAILDAISLSLY